MGEEPDRRPAELIVAAARHVRMLCEGQTEETFTRTVLAPHLRQFDVEVTAIQLTTKQLASGAKYRGGASSWTQIKRELLRLAQDSTADLVTTLLDYYGLPNVAPGKRNVPDGDAYARVRHVEAAMNDDLADGRIRVHLQMHEFEAMLFADPEMCGSALKSKALKTAMERALRTSGGRPELINDSRQTAPSKRILEACPRYRKATDGPVLVERMGLAAIRDRCPHFNQWLTMLESL